MKLSIEFLILIGISVFMIGMIIDGRRRKKKLQENFVEDYDSAETENLNVEYQSDSSNIAPERIQSIYPIPSSSFSLHFSEPSVSPAASFNDQRRYQPQSDSVMQETQNSDAIVISVLADPDQWFVGYELLQSLLSAGLRFGKMNIFHRYDTLHGYGNILFSVACATNPGTFDINNMGGFRCKGLTLFMKLNKVETLNASFELMLGTAKQLAQDLGGHLYNGNRAPLTEVNVKRFREQIREYLQAEIA